MVNSVFKIDIRKLINYEFPRIPENLGLMINNF